MGIRTVLSERFAMRRPGASIVFVLAFVAMLGPSRDAAAGHDSDRHDGDRDKMCKIEFTDLPRGLAKALAFHDETRKLWEDHIVWTRGFIISIAGDLPDAGFAAGRLLQNQADIGDSFRPFFGDAVADQLTALLREHILIAADILVAAHAGDADAAGEAIARWYVNADEISAFLNSINPRQWPLDEISEMMRMHLDTTLAEALARLGGDFAADIAAYDEVHHHILEMADFLSNGIIRRFPRKFR